MKINQILISALVGISSLQAAPVEWGPATTVSADSDISLNGTFIEAINASAQSVTNNPTVNGVEFTSIHSLLPSDNTGNLFNGTISPSYDQLLSDFDFGGTSPSISIGGENLEIGKNYEIQIWFSDTRNARVMRISDGENPAGTVDLGNGEAQYAIGTFTADATSQSLQLLPQGFTNAHITAYQLRRLNIPVVQLSTAAPSPVSAPFVVDVNFSEPITNLEESDFIITNGTVSVGSLTGNLTNWSIEINPISTGNVTVSLTAGSVNDLDGDNEQNLESNLLETFYLTPGEDIPIVSLSGPSINSNLAITVNIISSEPVTGLTLSDFQVTNATLSNLIGSGANYSILVTPNSNAAITITLPADAVTDLDSDNLSNLISNTLTISNATNAPAVKLIRTLEVVSSPFVVTVHFDREVSGLNLADFQISNGTLSNLVHHTTNPINYSITVTPVAEGSVTLSLPADSAISDTNVGNFASETLVTEYELNPRVTINGVNQSRKAELDVFFAFTPAIDGFEASDIEVTNGSVVSLEMQGRRDFADLFYKASIKANSPGAVTVFLPSGAVTSQSHPSFSNLSSNVFTTTVNDDFGINWVVDSTDEWTTNQSTASNISIAGGYVEPTATTATYSSVIKTFTTPQRAGRAVFTQSPAWDNWTAVGNIGPSGASNAPILLPLGNDDYYFFGRSNNAYRAWHSTDMVNWTTLDQFSETGDRWATSAEYMNGTFFLLVDTPNDHTPTMYTDTDLNDGQTGTNHGVVIPYDNSGGDSALFRDDSDGLFHIFSENFEPIRAPSHSWDSPLANHVSSVDGINGFVPREHLPPIDFRTEPTGQIGTYDHPHLAGSPVSNPRTYEIHSGEQKALGDWSLIKIGERYYTISDYEHDTGTGFINTGICWSNSLYDRFELISDVGNGHPDPTVGFAEGLFYLITQQNIDYTSPGPWVDGVEARAGVDVDNDGTIDQWTSWQAITESYDHTPGYARVITTSPAAVDMSSLPVGYGFQFELRLDNSLVAGVSPIMDRIEMEFNPSNFQLWANSRSTAANIDGDHNTNSIPNLIEFATGSEKLPTRNTNGILDLTITSEAIQDGITIELQYSENLITWTSATENTIGTRLIGTTIESNGDQTLQFELFPNTGSKLFWRLIAY